MKNINILEEELKQKIADTITELKKWNQFFPASKTYRLYPNHKEALHYGYNLGLDSAINEFEKLLL